MQKVNTLNEQHNYAKIGLEDGVQGYTILHIRLEHTAIRRKTIGLNNARRAIDREGKTKGLLGNDMYYNLKFMMEQGLIKFPDDDDLIRSLISIQIEVNKETKKETIFGKYSHRTEALKRGCQLIKAKGLRLWVV